MHFDSSALRELGWSSFFDEQFAAHAAAGLIPARVAVEHRGAYVVYGESGELVAELAGKMQGATMSDTVLASSSSRTELPPASPRSATGSRSARGPRNDARRSTRPCRVARTSHGSNRGIRRKSRSSPRTSTRSSSCRPSPVRRTSTIHPTFGDSSAFWRWHTRAARDRCS